MSSLAINFIIKILLFLFANPIFISLFLHQSSLLFLLADYLALIKISYLSSLFLCSISQVRYLIIIDSLSTRLFELFSLLCATSLLPLSWQTVIEAVNTNVWGWCDWHIVLLESAGLSVQWHTIFSNSMISKGHCADVCLVGIGATKFIKLTHSWTLHC